MLLTLRFPIVDLRPFGRVDYPREVRLPATWTEGTDFVRYFGPITRRMQGPVDPWVTERAFCRYDRAVRLAPSYANPLVRALPGVEFFGINRRLYTATARNDLFYADLQTVWRSPRKLDLSQAINAVLATPVAVRSPPDQVIDSRLGRLGPPFAHALDAATTAGGPSGLIHAGTPCVALETHNQERLSGTWLGPWDVDDDLRLNAATVAVDGRSIRVFRVARRYGLLPDRARALRIHLLRLHAEREFLRQMAHLLATEDFLGGCTHPQLERLQWSLNESLRNLTRARSYGFATEEITTAFLADRTLTGSELEVLIQRVEAFRPTIRRRLRTLQQQEDAREARWRSLIEANPRQGNYVYVKEVQMSNYDQRGSQIGVTGHGASADNVRFGAQLNLAMPATTPAELQLAIRTLRKHLADLLLQDTVLEVEDEEITAVQVGAAIGVLSEAEEAVAAQDDQRVLGALRRSGRWLASFADRVGVAVAAGAIRAALGIS